MSGSRRPDGALESAILRVLWDAEGPLVPAMIRDLLPMKLAYTSVATVLGRLSDRGLVGRHESGNAFAYYAAVDEATLIAQRMQAVLTQSSNRGTALAGFVDQLGQRDAQLLRSILEERKS